MKTKIIVVIEVVYIAIMVIFGVMPADLIDSIIICLSPFGVGILMFFLLKKVEEVVSCWKINSQKKCGLKEISIISDICLLLGLLSVGLTPLEALRIAEEGFFMYLAGIFWMIAALRYFLLDSLLSYYREISQK